MQQSVRIRNNIGINNALLTIDRVSICTGAFRLQIYFLQLQKISFFYLLWFGINSNRALVTFNINDKLFVKRRLC